MKVQTPAVAAFVLAGGKSLRMGQEKAFVCWEGRTLLQRALEAAGAVSGQVRIVGAKSKFEPFGEVVEDIFPDRGPLGGIHAALRASGEDLNLMLAVDLPRVTPQLLLYLVERAGNTEAVVTVPRLRAGWEPLCAVYRRPFAEVAEFALRGGRNTVHSLLRPHAVQAVEESELEEAGFSAAMLGNINTIADLEAVAGAPRPVNKDVVKLTL